MHTLALKANPVNHNWRKHNQSCERIGLSCAVGVCKVSCDTQTPNSTADESIQRHGVPREESCEKKTKGEMPEFCIVHDKSFLGWNDDVVQKERVVLFKVIDDSGGNVAVHTLDEMVSPDVVTLIGIHIVLREVKTTVNSLSFDENDDIKHDSNLSSCGYPQFTSFSKACQGFGRRKNKKIF